MLTLITWLSYTLAKPYMSNHFVGMTRETLMKMDYYINGPDYTTAIRLDLVFLVLIMLGVCIKVCYKWNKKIEKDSSSEMEP